MDIQWQLAVTVTGKIRVPISQALEELKKRIFGEMIA